MLPVSLRLPLRQQSDFWQLARRRHFPAFSVAWRWHPQPDNTSFVPIRCAVLSSKKVSNSAVLRNTAKRRMTAVVQQTISILGPSPHGEAHHNEQLQIVVQLKAPLLTATSPELQALWQEAFTYVQAH